MKTHKQTVFEYFNRNAIRERIKRCYKDDLLGANEEAFMTKVKAEVQNELKTTGALILELKDKNTKLEEQYTALEEKAKNTKTADPEELKSVKDEVVKLAGELKAAKESGNLGRKSVQSIGDILRANDAKIKDFIAKKSTSITLDFKATQTSSDIGSGDSWDTLGRDHWGQWHEGGKVGQIPTRQPFMQELFKTAVAKSEYIKYVDQDTIVRDAKNVAGCAASTHNSKVTFKKHGINIEKVRDFVHICDDMLDDYPFVESEIKNLIGTDIDLKVDNDLLFGTGVSPIINGVSKYASTFSASASGASYAGLVPNANIIDLMAVGGAQIKAFGQQNAFRPNVIAMNPKDAQMIQFLKNTQGDYLNNNQLIKGMFLDAAGGFYINGMRVIENPLVAENSAYIFDSSKGTVYQKPGVGIEFSYENRDNFETETVTVKAYRRLNLLVRNVDINAFLYIPDILAGVAAINKI